MIRSTRFALALTTIMAAPLIMPLLKCLSAGEPQVVDEETSVEEAENKPGRSKLLLNLAMKTGGGTQLWTDHLHRGGYRIQRHALTTHWRLLDSSDVRKAWGTRSHCESVLADLQGETPPQLEAAGGEQPSRHVVVLLHGLMRTHHSMKPLAIRLAEEGYTDVIRFTYASTRNSIGDHAAALREVLEGSPDNTQYSFVGHSMGNIVVRHLIGDLQRDGDPRGLLPRCRSMVMLGPPNQGAAIARRLAPTGLYGIVTGKGGLQLGPQWADFVQHLATPPFPFAIIAGDVSKGGVANPLVAGSSDFVVGVEEAQLDGSESFHTVPVLHSFLMNDDSTIKAAVEFIKSH